MKNLFKAAWLFTTGTVSDIVSEAEDILASMRNLLIAVLVAPLAVLVIGIAIAANADTMTGLGIGRGFITAASVAACLGSGVFLLRSALYATVLLGVSKAAKAAAGIDIEFKTEQVEKLIRALAGVFAWIVGACLYALVFPVWRNVGTSVIVAMCMMLMSATMAAGWFGSRNARIALVVSVFATFLICTARLSSVRLANAMDTGSQYAFGTDGDTNAERALIKQLKERREALQEKAVNSCSGEFCSLKDREEIVEIERKLGLLESGQYWESAGVHSAAATKTPEQAVTESLFGKQEAVGGSDTSEPNQSAVQADPEPQKPALKASKETWALLDQFPDITGGSAKK